nr:hypothetical protein Itr_chr01CG24420 [Ipomoea trifida]
MSHKNFGFNLNYGNKTFYLANLFHTLLSIMCLERTRNPSRVLVYLFYT